MRPSEALHAHREDIRRVVAAHRAGNVRVFGSVLHENDVEGSDLDLLIDPTPGTTLLDLGGIQADIEDMLGVPVDVLTPGDLPDEYRMQVLREALPL